MRIFILFSILLLFVIQSCNNKSNKKILEVPLKIKDSSRIESKKDEILNSDIEKWFINANKGVFDFNQLDSISKYSDASLSEEICEGFSNLYENNFENFINAILSNKLSLQTKGYVDYSFLLTITANGDDKQAFLEVENKLRNQLNKESESYRKKLLQQYIDDLKTNFDTEQEGE